MTNSETVQRAALKVLEEMKDSLQVQEIKNNIQDMRLHIAKNCSIEQCHRIDELVNRMRVMLQKEGEIGVMAISLVGLQLQLLAEKS